MDLNIIEQEKLIDLVSDFTLQLTSGLPFFEFWCHIKEGYSQLSGKAVKIYFFFQPHIYVRVDFLLILQPNNIAKA